MDRPDLTNLHAELGLRTVGRKPKLVFELDHELTEEDLRRVAQAPEGDTKAPEVKKMRRRHHALAKLLAQGVKPGDAGLITGFSASRVSVLQGDPSFKDLIAIYSRDIDAKAQELHDKLFDLAVDAADELADRIENGEEELSIGQLLEIAKFGADRTGHGPSSNSTVNVNIGIGEKMAAARERVERARQSRMIDITPEDDDAA